MEENRADRATADDRKGSEATEKTTSAGMTRRRTLRLSGLLGVGGLVGATGVGVDGVAAAPRNDNRTEERIHLDYDDYDSWDDVYRRTSGDSDNISFVSDPTYSGDTATQIRIREGSNWGVSTHYDFEDGLLELNGRVRFALDDDWAMGGRELANCRLWNCAMGLGPGSAGGGIPDGTNGWSNRMYVTNKGTDPDGPFHLLSNSYNMDRIHDSDYIIAGEDHTVQEVEIIPGEWYEFEYYVRMNTVDNGVANSDGVIRYWLDGDLIYDRQNFRFTEDLENNIIDTSGPVGHYGGRYEAPQDLSVYYDDHSMVLDGTFDDEPEEPEQPEETDPITRIVLPDWIQLPDGVTL